MLSFKADAGQLCLQFFKLLVLRFGFSFDFVWNEKWLAAGFSLRLHETVKKNAFVNSMLVYDVKTGILFCEKEGAKAGAYVFYF